MKTPSNERGQAEGLPLTHTALLSAGRTGGPAPWVQVRKNHHEGPYVMCGRVLELSGGRGEWFKVETALGVAWYESRNVRLCSGDGRCTCEAEPEAWCARARPDLRELTICQLVCERLGIDHE